MHSIADIEALPWPPRTINVKPSRLGGLQSLLDVYDYCAAHEHRLLRRRAIGAERRPRPDPVPRLAVPCRRAQRRRPRRLQPARAAARPALQPARARALAPLQGFRWAETPAQAQLLCRCSVCSGTAAKVDGRRFEAIRFSGAKGFFLANSAPQRSMFSLAAAAFALLCCCSDAAWSACRRRQARPTRWHRAHGSTKAPAGATGKSAPSHKTAPKQASASLHVLTVRITSVSCMPTARCNTNAHEVSTHGTLLLKGKGLTPGMIVAFPHTPGGRIGPSSPYSHLRNSTLGLILTVPSKAHSGHIMVLLSHGRHTSSYGPITVVRYALHPPAPPKAHRDADRHRGQRDGVRRPGHVDLVREPVRRRQRRLDRRPGARRRRDHACSSRAPTDRPTTGASSRPSWWPNCTRTA